MKKILLVVDMQNGFARCDQTIKLTVKIRKLLERELFDSVIATRFRNGDNSIYEKVFGWRRLKTKEDIELADGYEKYADCVLDKSVYTSVNSSFIQKLCQLNDCIYP